MSVDVSYYSFSPSRADKKWLEEGGEAIMALRANYPNMPEDELVQEVIQLDLQYGSVRNVAFEEPKLEHQMISAIVQDFSLALSNGVPSREEWLKFLLMVKERRMHGVLSILADEFGEEDADTLLKGYLQEITPVLKDLQATSDAAFYRLYDGEGGEPEELEKLLAERAKQHIAA